MPYAQHRASLRETTSSTPFRYAGSAYQLFSSFHLHDGCYVEINGPHDTFGVVTSSVKQEDGRFLNQVRGIKPKIGFTPVAAL